MPSHSPNPLRVLELGSYVAPAYAGMILAEQGHEVTKWTTSDPILGLRQGDELWRWINHGKTLTTRHAKNVADLEPGTVDVIIDNFRADTWARWGISPTTVAERLQATWVSIRADDDDRSFDVIAQARAWGDHGVLPFYLGDTAVGLWAAFKALAAPVGHHVIRQAACLAHLVEGDAVVNRPEGRYPYDEPGTYCFEEGVASVSFKGETISEPVRDAAWRLKHLANKDGRFTV
ncbi:CoA transferase [Actinomyces urogenitalis]|uniref:CoA transferase n=1 Tax=Actinomyces urogenitalis TaxID=103621 RepID=UPI002B4BA2F2|nr:CoA transferase [Actinomyces urogenitalis]